MAFMCAFPQLEKLLF